MAEVLLVDDDRKLLSLLERGFRFEGFDVRVAASGEDALRAAGERAPDLVILDIGMAGIDGHQTCQRLRAGSDVPILMLTARDDVEEKVRAFDIGADDYVTKPFAFDELLARTRALLRRRHSGTGEKLTFAGIICDLPRREVVRDGRAISLSPREFDLLVHFLRNPRQVLSREALLDRVWGFDFAGDTKVVDVYVGYLRQKLGDPRLIHTYRGVGYALRE